MLQAQSIIVSVFGADVPLSVKYNLHLLEAYNRMEEGEEKVDLLTQISDKNLQIVKDIWGEDHLFTIRLRLTSYLAAMVKGDGEKAGNIFDQMNNLQYDGIKITANRYIFKAKLQSILILMQVPD